MSIDKHRELKDRTKMFALRIIKMSDALPKTRAANVITNQILRSATSMGANNRAVGRARSKAEFLSKLGIVVEEADETVFGSKCSQMAESSQRTTCARCSTKPIS